MGSSVLLTDSEGNFSGRVWFFLFMLFCGLNLFSRYVGELIDQAEAAKRSERMDTSFLFDLDWEYINLSGSDVHSEFKPSRDEIVTVDAFKFGGFFLCCLSLSLIPLPQVRRNHEVFQSFVLSEFASDECCKRLSESEARSFVLLRFSRHFAV